MSGYALMYFSSTSSILTISNCYLYNVTVTATSSTDSTVSSANIIGIFNGMNVIFDTVTVIDYMSSDFKVLAFLYLSSSTSAASLSMTDTTIKC
jgi:hypothetical protein